MADTALALGSLEVAGVRVRSFWPRMESALPSQPGVRLPYWTGYIHHGAAEGHPRLSYDRVKPDDAAEVADEPLAIVRPVQGDMTGIAKVEVVVLGFTEDEALEAWNRVSEAVAAAW